MTALKTCTRCGKPKPADTDHFHAQDSIRPGKLHATCRDCRNRYNRTCYRVRRAMQATAQKG